MIPAHELRIFQGAPELRQQDTQLMQCKTAFVVLRMAMGGKPPGQEQQRQEQGQRRQVDIVPAPAQPEGEKPGRDQRADQVAGRAEQRPARHHLRLAARVEVHQGGLRQGDKGAAGWVVDHESDQGGGESLRTRQQQGGQHKDQPAADDQLFTQPGIAQQHNEELDGGAEHGRQAEQQAHLRIG